MTGIQHVRVEGTPYERGRRYGAQARARVRRSVQAYQQVFGTQPFGQGTTIASVLRT